MKLGLAFAAALTLAVPAAESAQARSITISYEASYLFQEFNYGGLPVELGTLLDEYRLSKITGRFTLEVIGEGTNDFCIQYFDFSCPDFGYSSLEEFKEGIRAGLLFEFSTPDHLFFFSREGAFADLDQGGTYTQETWTFTRASMDGELIYVAPVPLPSSALLLLTPLGALFLRSRRRALHPA